VTRVIHQTESLEKTCLETTAYYEATETDTEKIQPDPRMMQSVVEQQEVAKEEAAVMSVGGVRKRRRDQNLAAGRRQKPKERIKASCESRRRLTVRGRKMTRHAGVAWRRKNFVRKMGTEEVGCRLQEGVQLCKSGMAQEERRQKNWDPGKLWTAQGVRRRRNKGDPLRKSGTAQGMQS
jgi:hypothetical protein